MSECEPVDCGLAEHVGLLNGVQSCGRREGTLLLIMLILICEIVISNARQA